MNTNNKKSNTKKKSERSFTKSPEEIQRYRDQFDERRWPPENDR